MSEAPVRSFAESNLALVEAFERYLLARNFSASVQQQYPATLHSLCDFLGSDGIATADLGALRIFLSQRSATSYAFRANRSALRSFYRFLILGKVINASPAFLIARPRIARRLPKCLTEKEAERLILSAGGRRDRALLELLYSSGLRASEISNLDIEDLDLDRRTLRVRRGKGGKDRVGFFGSKAADALRAYCASALRPRVTGPVFLNDRRQRLSSNLVSRIVKRTARLAGLEGVHAHTLRHTFATVLLNRGADVRYVQELLGHERVATTGMYLHTAIADVARVYAKCHPHSGGQDGQ